MNDEKLMDALDTIEAEINSKGLHRPKRKPKEEEKMVPRKKTVSRKKKSTTKKAPARKKAPAKKATAEKRGRPTASGHTATKMAEELGIAPMTVRKHLRTLGISKPGSSWTWEKATEFKKVMAAVKKAHASGGSPGRKPKAAATKKKAPARKKASTKKRPAKKRPAKKRAARRKA